MRRYLTEILLDVTNTEIEAVAKEVYFKARNRAAKGNSIQRLFHFILLFLKMISFSLKLFIDEPQWLPTTMSSLLLFKYVYII